MKADAPLEQKRPKYHEIVLQKLEGDRKKNEFTEVKHVSSCGGLLVPKEGKKKSVNLLFLVNVFAPL